MQHLEVSGAVRPVYGSLGFKRLIDISQLTIQLSPALSESGSHISPSVNCVSATYLQNDANNTKTIATSYNET